ncbi:hypothetical protein E6C55_12270 [Cohnella fermenti]|uniref:Uncharacterized protein n=1 Tax=Cohnella fermenti TaxID=2565925 RepID=A0A4S4BWP1_9BACL|nr:hypothetical protein E6C55_12270 [Cohnella fermenti]
MQQQQQPSGSGVTVQQKATYFMGRPVGISFRNGTGASGILCNVQNGQLSLLQYLYHSQFATFHYPLTDIADVLPYPTCG